MFPYQVSLFAPLPLVVVVVVGDFFIHPDILCVFNCVLGTTLCKFGQHLCCLDYGLGFRASFVLHLPFVIVFNKG